MSFEASAESPGVLVVRNPATGEETGRVPVTAAADVAGVVARAREAQRGWARQPASRRLATLNRWRRILGREADGFADAIRDEVGKPRGEATAEVLMGLDAIRWTARNAKRALRPERLGVGWQRWLLMPGGQIHHLPIGVVGMIGTWNYPFYLNAPPIAQAIAAGNAVVWKPSELAPSVGLRLQRTLDQAGFPEGLVAAVMGGADVGRALVESAIDKGVFTGGIENGRRVLGALASRGIPAVAELSGFDPAIILPDAPLASTTRALAWGAFVGSGQACVAVKRIYVVGEPTPWVEALATLAGTLRVGDPARLAVDLGPLISESARNAVDARVRAAVAAGATVRFGGTPLPGPGWFYPPTVLASVGPAPEAALAGIFGPVVVVRGVPDADAAVAAANASRYGLAASVWGRDCGAAYEVGLRLEAGLVTINEAVTPTGHASAPFGGVKASGHGRTKGVLGLREFTQSQAILIRSDGGFRPQLFPYSSRTEWLLRWYRRAFHPAARRLRRPKS